MIRPSPTVLVLLCLALAIRASVAGADENTPPKDTGYVGSAGCRGCHEKFHQLWATSRHGLAMQPYTARFAKESLTPQAKAVRIGKSSYRAVIGGETGWVEEEGTAGRARYKIEHTLGGKNVYYFLTLLPRGRLQTLPLAYDVRRKEWFDTAASGLRHVPGAPPDRPVGWRDPAYTFNTSCYGCHVSQLETNYDARTDTYATTWAEAGINCETCHGPGSEHVRVCREAPGGTVPADLKIIRVKSFTAEQHNAACSGCHAKASPITTTFAPRERFFDHFDLVTLEDADFYPDGRDLGENFTATSWMMNPCVKAGEMHCVLCHTASGRNRFREARDADNACMPCHAERVEGAAAHSHHKEDSPGSRCVACHMPVTSFARMRRSDHSMLPPVPAATIAYKAPNACNLCHTDRDAAWADKAVRRWYPRDYQAPLLERAALVDAARRRDWSRLPAMLDYVARKDRDEVFATSLIRLIPASGDGRIVPALREAIKDPSPLVRAAAADALQRVPASESRAALLAATRDSYRLVRVRAVASLVAQGNLPVADADRTSIEAALGEYLASILARPDQWSSHYNLGNAYLSLGDPGPAVAAYGAALGLEPQSVLAMVNQSMAYAQLGETQNAEESLRKALAIAPDNATANFNLGLLEAERQDTAAAERHLEKALAADPQMAQAAYNLCILTAKDRLAGAIGYCRQASALRPDEPKYAYTLAFYLRQNGETDEAVATLQATLKAHPGYGDARRLLEELTKGAGKP